MLTIVGTGQPASVAVAGRILPFTSYEDVVLSYRTGLERAGLRPCDDRPPCFILDAAGTPIAKIGSRRTYMCEPDGAIVDYSPERLIFDFGEDE